MKGVRSDENWKNQSFDDEVISGRAQRLNSSQNPLNFHHQKKARKSFVITNVISKVHTHIYFHLLIETQKALGGWVEIKY